MMQCSPTWCRALAVAAALGLIPALATACADEDPRQAGSSSAQLAESGGATVAAETAATAPPPSPASAATAPTATTTAPTATTTASASAGTATAGTGTTAVAGTATAPTASPAPTATAATAATATTTATAGTASAPATAVVAPVDTPPVAVTVAPTSVRPATTPYGVPVADVERAGWGDTHSTYPATDIFLGCGADVVSPVNGTVLEVRRVDSYDPAIDNPATRGGQSVAILGDDGVRYYLAHFETIVEPLEPGNEVTVGHYLGAMGETGRTSACHLHFSISPPCPGKEWSVRRGVIWPAPYLDAWRNGEALSPVDEVAAWVAARPTACSDAMSDPTAADA